MTTRIPRGKWQFFRLVISTAVASACLIRPAFSQQVGTARNFDSSNSPTPWNFPIWAGSNEHMAECLPGGPGKGLSAASNGKAHSLLCKSPLSSALNFYDWSSSQSLRPTVETFASSDSSGYAPHAHFNWDVGYLKGECQDGKFVIGAAQSNNGALNAMLCSRDSNTSTPVKPIAGWGGCVTRTLPGNQPATLPDGNWAAGFDKLGCNSNEVMVGISASPTSHKPHRILCCNLFNDQAGGPQTCPAVPPACPETVGGGCDLANGWPGGVVNYTLTNKGAIPVEEQGVVNAMRDWETLTAGALSFHDVTGVNPPPSPLLAVTINPTGSGGVSSVGPGGAQLSAFSAYHELGHALGLLHPFQRFDRNRYSSINHTSYYDSDDRTCDSYSRCLDATGDFGPFDYRSAMSYVNVTFPDITRWNGTALSSVSCDPRVAKGFTADPLWFTRLCTNCDSSSPGTLAKSDGAAIVEMLQYQTGGWDKFQRTETVDSTARVPYPSTIASNVSIVGSPAITSTDPGTAQIFVRGSDKQLYHKDGTISGSPPSWPAWAVLTNGTFNSDPAAVSWASGRIDLVARGEDNNIWLRTFASGSWGGGYDSLGAPAGGAASAPAITSWGPGRLDVLVRGTDNRLYWRACSTTGTDCSSGSGNWNAWQAVGGSGIFRGKPAAATRQSGVVDVFVHGTDDHLWGIELFNGQWGGYYQVSATGTLGWYTMTPHSGSCTNDDCFSPAVTAWPLGLHVVMRGVDDKAWVASWSVGDATWSGFTPIGGVLTAAPAMPTRFRSASRIDLAGTMDEERETGTFVPTMWWKQYPKP